MASDPTAPASRLADLMRQGFMKPRPEAKQKAAPPKSITCYECQNWHRPGKHTEPNAAKRLANRKEAKSKGWI